MPENESLERALGRIEGKVDAALNEQTRVARVLDATDTRVSRRLEETATKVADQLERTATKVAATLEQTAKKAADEMHRIDSRLAKVEKWQTSLIAGGSAMLVLIGIAYKAMYVLHMLGQ